MIETYHYAGFSVQTAIANEQCDRNAADELIRSRKTPRYCGAEKTSLWRMPKIEDCLAEGSQFELTGDFVSGLQVINRQHDASVGECDSANPPHRERRSTTKGFTVEVSHSPFSEDATHAQITPVPVGTVGRGAWRVMMRR